MGPTSAMRRRPNIRTERRGRGTSIRAVAGMLVVLWAKGGMAQTLRVEPSVTATMRYTSNSGADAVAKDDLMTEVAPSVAILREGGRLTGRVNASLRNVVYANDADRNDSFLSLQGFGQFEAVERTWLIDADATMGRSSRSLLFGRVGGDPLETSSDNETRSFGLGTQFNFRLGPETSGTANYRTRWLNGNGGLSGSRTSDLGVELSNPVQFGKVGWGLSYNRSDSEYSSGGQSAAREEIARGTLFVTLSPQFRLRGSVGYESNDYATGAQEDSSVVGGGFDWFPTERTSVSGTTEKRVFGRSHSYSLSHRFARSVWNFSYSRDISSSPELFGVSVFSDPTFKALYDALAPSIPDPLVRERLVRLLLGYPLIGPRGVFISNAHFLSRNVALSASFLGVRNVLTLTLQDSDRSRLGASNGLDPFDDFSRFANLRSRTASVALNHRLTPLMALNGSLSHIRSEGSGGRDEKTQRVLFNLGLTRQFGRDADGSLLYTHQRAEGGADFVENVLMATFTLRF